MERTLKMIDDSIKVLRLGNGAMCFCDDISKRLDIAKDQDLAMDCLEGLIEILVKELTNEK